MKQPCSACDILPRRQAAGASGWGLRYPIWIGKKTYPPQSNGLMKTTTLLILTALVLSAEGKLTTEDKLQLSRAEAAAAKAQATLTNFVSQAQRAVQELEAKAKDANDAHQKLIADLKKKLLLDAACTFDENQEPKCPAKEVKK